MLGFGETFVVTAGSLLVPAFLGLVVISGAGRFLSGRYLLAFALGIFFWYFSDTINDTGQLEVSAGFTGGMQQAGLYALFALGLVCIFALDARLFSGEAEGPKTSLSVPVLVAVAIGIHGFGEGAAIGSIASQTASTYLFDAFGGLSASVAFVLHKALEPMIVGACYYVYSRDRSAGASGRIRDLAVLTLVFSAPALAGVVSGYYVPIDTAYAFSLATGTSVYAALRLVKPMFGGQGDGSHAAKMAILTVLGFTCLYVAALLHA